MNAINKAKIKTIIKTVLITQPQKHWTASQLATFINTHNYNINTEVNARRIGQLIKTEKKSGSSFLKDIEVERMGGNKYKYSLKEKK